MDYVYGCDFSGASNPSKKIFYAAGQLTKHSLDIIEIKHCEDRLDLYNAITSYPGYWGMDLPFSLSAGVLQNVDVSGPIELYRFTSSMARHNFRALFRQFSKSDTRRQTDICCNAKSPLSAAPIDMIGMAYGGFKLLHYLERYGINIYPFIYRNHALSELFEVYPSHTWKAVKLPRGTPVKAFVQAFVENFNFNVSVASGAVGFIDSLPPEMRKDALDSVVACATLGYALRNDRFHLDRAGCPSFATASEWRIRSVEGLIVRT